MKMNLKKGFTLIELLVVVAIIGILASVVLASLNSARAKSADASVKENLANARAQAALFYAANGDNYADPDGADATMGVCNEVASAGTPPIEGIYKFLVAAKNASGAVVIEQNTELISSNIVCNYDQGQWLAAAPLKNGNLFCVDSVGAAKEMSFDDGGIATGNLYCY